MLLRSRQFLQFGLKSSVLSSEKEQRIGSQNQHVETVVYQEKEMYQICVYAYMGIKQRLTLTTLDKRIK